MDIVVDTSVVIAVIVNEPIKATLISLTTGATLLAPTSIYWEVGNAFSAMLKRQRITLAQAQQAIATYYQIPLRLLDVKLAQAVDLADHLGIYAYDAYIIACALNQKCPILTLDSGLIYAAKRLGVPIVEVPS